MLIILTLFCLGEGEIRCFISCRSNEIKKKTTITTKAKMTEKQSRKAATFNFILKINGKRYSQVHINLAHQRFNPFQRYGNSNRNFY